MRIVIQDSSGESYFDGDSWTPDIVKAMDFESTTVAERFCLERKLAGAVIVVKFINPEVGDIRFPAGARDALRNFETSASPGGWNHQGRWQQRLARQ